ncbi:MAG: hypothetical protein H6851_10600 [Geminicoccaceae bacterium]|nr:hypothetical protein [Geminicoccaceae bacterium]
MMSVSRSIALVGTDSAEEPAELIEVGPLSFMLDGGRVRYIRYRGVEAIRGIDYLVRDANWATPVAELSNFSVDRDDDRAVTVRFRGTVDAEPIRYVYDVVIQAGIRSLVFRVEGQAETAFDTNRTGFTILHPIEGTAGAPVTVEHCDGSREETCFPLLISPGQPIFSIRAMTHAPAPGLTCTCRMEAELPHDPDGKFEMEDQRNWTDASYKTYVASLLDPWPYRLEPGRTWKQAVIVSFEGEPGSAGGSVADASQSHRIPPIGLGLMPEAASHAHSRIGDVPPADWLSFYLDLDAGDDGAGLAACRDIAEAMGASIQLELVLSPQETPAEELTRAADLCREAGLEPAIVLPCPAPYLKSIQPVGPWPNVPDLAHIYNEARRAFPAARIAGGMLSYFTELNRKRPPTACIDLVSHTTTAIVHAGDDVSVMETLQALPQVARSAHGLAGGKPVRLGPSAIGMRHNPYGAALIPNPENRRFAMADPDPRQRGLFAASWSLAHAAALLPCGLEALLLNHISGPLGILHDPAVHPAPGFSARTGPLVYPVYHVMRWLIGRAGEQAVVKRFGDTAVAIETGRGTAIANTGMDPVHLPQSMALLDVSGFEAACTDPQWLDHPTVEGMTLDAYSVAFSHG